MRKVKSKFKDSKNIQKANVNENTEITFDNIYRSLLFLTTKNLLIELDCSL